MDTNLKESKQVIRAFMKEHYTDERLTWLLAHARAGRLAYYSCCCFIGIPTADHALQGEDWQEVTGGTIWTEHIAESRRIPGALAAEKAFGNLSDFDSPKECDEQRRRRLVPIIKAELRRRERIAATDDRDWAVADRVRFG